MRSIFVIGIVTFIELMRQRLVVALVFVGFLLLAFSLLLASLTFDEQLRIILHIGFGAIQIVLILLSFFIGGTIFHKELERQTFFMILARPIQRTQVYWGKMLGICFLLSLFHLILFVVHFWLVGKLINFPERFVWAHFALWVEVMCILSVTYSMSFLFKPALAISLGFLVWIMGYWIEHLVYFAKVSKIFIYEFLSFFGKYVIPKLNIGSELRSIYFVNEDLINQWGALYILQIFLFGLFILLIGERFILKKDL